MDYLGKKYWTIPSPFGSYAKTDIITYCKGSMSMKHANWCILQWNIMSKYHSMRKSPPFVNVSGEVDMNHGW